MRILITGGAGFIGSHVVDACIHAGHTVAIVDNMTTGIRANVHPDAVYYDVDIREAEALEHVFRDFRPDIVNHHAAQIDVRKSIQNPEYDAQVNIIGSLHLLKLSAKYGIAKFIYASSGGAVYGEPIYLPADERHPIQPICEYGVSKYTVEQYLGVYGNNYGLNYAILRYSNVYGPRQSIHGEAGVIAIFAGRLLAGQPVNIYGDGESQRDYLYVGDVVQANLLALEHGDRVCVNISTGVGSSVNTVYRLVAEATESAISPVYAPARLGEIQTTYQANRLAADLLNWRPQVTLAEGISRTVNCLRASVEGAVNGDCREHVS